MKWIKKIKYMLVVSSEKIKCRIIQIKISSDPGDWVENVFCGENTDWGD